LQAALALRHRQYLDAVAVAAQGKPGRMAQAQQAATVALVLHQQSLDR
jgi:hypothetical protein